MSSDFLYFVIDLRPASFDISLKSARLLACRVSLSNSNSPFIGIKIYVLPHCAKNECNAQGALLSNAETGDNFFT
ncbi:MAG: hypothetical protein BWY62_01364 [Firmicutes bacterium ADurb.Bin356]|nr:MAG: hypothetical protein BWY62_01364 [Firmicutes bacterium ADurb.Bin356]